MAPILLCDLCDFVVIYLAQLLHAHFPEAEIKAELMISQSGSAVISPMNPPVFGQLMVVSVLSKMLFT